MPDLLPLKTYASDLDVTAGEVDLGNLHNEIKDSGHVNGYTHADLEGIAIKIYGTSIADESALDTLIQNHIAVPLDQYKKKRYNEIDKKTGGMIAAGFTYDSKQFSLSLNAQSNWNALKDDTSEFTWPAEISTIDEDTYDLDEANVGAFWNAGKDVLKGHLDSGRALKKSIKDATDKAGVDAVVDNR